MLYTLSKRFLSAVATVWAVVTVTFIIVRLVPADPAAAAAGPGASAEQIAQLKHTLGLDKPVPRQYIDFCWGLLHGDFGRSAVTQQSVSHEIAQRLPATLEIVLLSFLVYVVASITAGVVAATIRWRFIDTAIRFGAIAAMAIPVFWLAIVFQIVFFAHLHWLPLDGRLSATTMPPPHVTGFFTIDSILAGQWATFWNSVQHLVLPVGALVLSLAALGTRMTRATMLRELDQPYVRFARAKGIPEWLVVIKHALRNALNPVLTLMGMQFGFLLGGTVLVEVIFSWPGIGLYASDSFNAFDYSPIEALTIVTAVTFVVANMLVDLMYPILDPRVRIPVRSG
jgi:peptide/nickel transport system permease protein